MIEIDTSLQHGTGDPRARTAQGMGVACGESFDVATDPEQVRQLTKKVCCNSTTAKRPYESLSNLVPSDFREISERQPSPFEYST